MIVENFDKENFKLSFEFDKKLSSIAQSLPNRVFKKSVGGWIFPIADFFILKKLCKDNNVNLQATPDANKRYAEVAMELKSIKDLSDSKDVEYKPLGLKKDVKLFPFQKVAVKFIEKIQSGLVALDMGLGKSLIGIAIASDTIAKAKKRPRILIISPASVKYEWAIQIGKFTNYSYTIVGGKDREKQYNKTTNFIVVNYDLLYRDIDMLKDMEWDLVICDEIQRARNYKTDTVKAMSQLQSKRRVGLTGTPIENDLMDLFTVMKFLTPKVFGINPIPFKNRYCTTNFFGQIDHGKYKNLEEINKKVVFSMIRRRKRDVLDDLPELVENNFYITLNTSENKKYKEIKAGILEDVNSGKVKFVNTLTQVGYLRQLCDCLNLVEENEKIISSKFKELKQIIDDLPPDAKIVIFTQYERMAKIIEEHIGYTSVHLHGGVKNDCRLDSEIEKDITKYNPNMPEIELDQLIHEEKQKDDCGTCPYYNDDDKCHTRKKISYKFNNEKDIKIFISTDAGKAGLNLQTAWILINYDLSFNPAVNRQRGARIDRMGQLNDKVLIINLICLNTIEEKVLKILEKKQQLFDTVIDDISEDEFERVVLNNTSIKDLI